MEPRRLSRGEWAAAIAGIVMIVALFLPWYETGDRTFSAWESMAVDDVILAVTAILAIVAALVVAFPRISSVSVAATSLAVLPATVGLVVTLYRLVSPAPPFDVSLGVGAWLGFAATLAIMIGGWAGASDEGPARRNPETERRIAAEAMERAELLDLQAAPKS